MNALNIADYMQTLGAQAKAASGLTGPLQDYLKLGAKDLDIVA